MSANKNMNHHSQSGVSNKALDHMQALGLTLGSTSTHTILKACEDSALEAIDLVKKAVKGKLTLITGCNCTQRRPRDAHTE